MQVTSRNSKASTIYKKSACNELLVIGSTIIKKMVESGISLSLSNLLRKKLLSFANTLLDLLNYTFWNFNCKKLREILGLLPDGVCECARSDILMDPQSSTLLLHQVILSPSLFDDFKSKIKGSVSEDEDNNCEIRLLRNESKMVQPSKCWKFHFILGWSEISKFFYMHCFKTKGMYRWIWL